MCLRLVWRRTNKFTFVRVALLHLLRGARSNHCEQTEDGLAAPPQSSTLSLRSQEMNLCAQPLYFSCCIYEKASSWMYLERYLSLNESLFFFAEYICWTNGNVQMSAIYVCLLGSFPFSFPPPSCLYRAVQFVSCWKHRHVAQREDLPDVL